MVRTIRLKKLFEVSDKEMLGVYPTERDFDEIIDEDCDVYLPDGRLGLSFRKKALKTVMSVTPDSSTFEYWRWVSRFLLSDQRGNAAGKEITTNAEIRFTYGQMNFLRQAVKRELSLEEAIELIESDPRPCRDTYYVWKVEEDGLVDIKWVKRWDSIVRRPSMPEWKRKKATIRRNKAKLAWFNNWLHNVWAVSEDKIQCAKDARKRYHTNQPRGNKSYSAVMGTIDRSGRTPYGRLTKPTKDRWEEFTQQTPFFNEVDDLLKTTMPKTWEILSKRFKHVKDKAYNLFGTCFTSITVNWNFQVAYHYDGNNAKDAAAVLTVMEKGTYEGSEFVFPQLRLAFNLRHGDYLGGDNQGLMHGMMPFRGDPKEYESIWFVFYQRDSIITLDPLKCENCRYDFMAYITENYPELGTGEKKWNGSFPGMWNSQYWKDYKQLRKDEAKSGDKFDYTQCTDTNIKGDLDQIVAEVRNPHLKKT